VTAPAAGRVAVRTEALSIDEASALVAHPGAGGAALFIGTVRDVNEGRAVTKLEYEAYTSMAVAEMDRIRTEIEGEIEGACVAALHRVGALEIGEIAVVCAASAPHRDEAFRACRLMIDRLKARVPIWKREHGPQGPYWVGWQDARCAQHQD
jgi:molybdopterin synthase catalytic subunit